MNTQSIILGALIMAVSCTANADKAAPSYSLFRNVSLDSSTNRFDKCVYIGGWVKNGSGVYAWRKGLLLSDILRDAGEIHVRHKDDPANWTYSAKVFRPTTSDPDPSQSCYHAEINSEGQLKQSNIGFALLPEDVVLVMRQKKVQQVVDGKPPKTPQQPR